MYSCPHCGSGTISLTRTHTVEETIVATEMALDGTYTELDNRFGDTVDTGPWDSATCTSCDADLALLDIFPREAVPPTDESTRRGTAKEAP
jgi:hypothetical protein